MANRLVLHHAPTFNELWSVVNSSLKVLAKREPNISGSGASPIANCCRELSAGGAIAILEQTQVQDPDFLAEYSAYYSRQFVDIERFCTRLHFFSHWDSNNSNILTFLDSAPDNAYLGFVTLRPVIKSPVGATIIASRIASGFVRSKDEFPVHIGGRKFEVTGTPFMQQDNAVGACAQASIWMALRTLRKKEGDRAHDPAQITDAATRYFVNGRTLPNREGLTSHQMTGAIRAAGYSPHMIPLGSWRSIGAAAMSPDEIVESMKTIHAYIESDIPVILILYPPSGGHAVVAIGHTWDPAALLSVRVRGTIFIAATATTPQKNIDLNFIHATSWIPSWLINNDNTSPYRKMPSSGVAGEYCFEHAAYAIPLLPADVFMSGEEASVVGTGFLTMIFQGFLSVGVLNEQSAVTLADSLALRWLLVEKRKLRKWAAEESMPKELADELRLMEMPKRIWIMEIHLAATYANQSGTTPNSLVGLILIDPTGETHQNSILLAYLSLPSWLSTITNGMMLTWDKVTGVMSQGVQTTEIGPIKPLRL